MAFCQPVICFFYFYNGSNVIWSDWGTCLAPCRSNKFVNVPPLSLFVASDRDLSTMWHFQQIEQCIVKYLQLLIFWWNIFYRHNMATLFHENSNFTSNIRGFSFISVKCTAIELLALANTGPLTSDFNIQVSLFYIHTHLMLFTFSECWIHWKSKPRHHCIKCPPVSSRIITASWNFTHRDPGLSGDAWLSSICWI